MSQFAVTTLSKRPFGGSYAAAERHQRPFGGAA